MTHSRIGIIGILLLAGCHSYRPTDSHVIDLPSLAPAVGDDAGGELPVDLTDGLSANEAQRFTLQHNPELEAKRAEIGIASAELRGLTLANPSLTLGPDIPIAGAVNGSVIGFSLELGWEPTSGLGLRADRHAGRLNEDARRLEVLAAEWDLAEQARSRFFHVVALDQKLSIARDIEQQRADSLELQDHAAAEGVVPRVELVASRAAFEKARGARLDLERQRALAMVGLLEIMGESDRSVTIDPGAQLPSKLSTGSEEILLKGLAERRPDLLAIRRAMDSEDAHYRAEVLRRFPPISVSVVGARDTGNLVSGGVSVGVALPVFDRNQGPTAVALATRDQLAAELTARIFHARFEVRRLLSEAALVERQIEAARAATPALQELVDIYAEAVAQRQADVVSYYAAWGDLADNQLQLVDLREQLTEVMVGLERATGRIGVDVDPPPHRAQPTPASPPREGDAP